MEISCKTCPRLSNIQIQNLHSNDIRSLFDFINADKRLICAYIQADDTEYFNLRQSLLKTMQPHPTSLRQVVDSKTSPMSSSLSGFDNILGGGLFAGDIIEFYGKTGSGKTQLSLFYTSRYCSNENQSNVLYFDLKNDFNALRLFKMCGSIENRLKHVKLFRHDSLKSLLFQLDCIKDSCISGTDSFNSRCKLIVIDSVPMVIYPAVNEENKFTSWRVNQELLLKRLHWFAEHRKLSVILVNHAITPRESEPSEGGGYGKTVGKVKPAMGKYWQSAINFRVQLGRLPGFTNRFRGTLEKSSRNATGQSFEFSIENDQIVDVILS